MTIREFLERHDSRELAEIEARDNIDPFDWVWRIEVGLARIASLLFNANRDPNKSEVLPSSEFTPKWGRKYREEVEAEIVTEESLTDSLPQSAEAVRAKMQAMLSRHRV